MNKINTRFHIDGERIVKTSNGEAIPDDEPVFILRGRDGLAYATLCEYRELVQGNRELYTRENYDLFMSELNATINDFMLFAKRKLPGVTGGY